MTVYFCGILASHTMIDRSTSKAKLTLERAVGQWEEAAQILTGIT